MSIRRKLLLALPLATLLIVAGCKVNTINYFPPHPANVRVMNLMPGTPGIDVKVAGNPAFSGVQFETATGYQSFDNVTTTFTVSLTGSTTALSTFTYPLAGEQPYTLILYGSPSNASATLLAEVANPPTNGNIQVSVFNAAINNAGVDIYVTAPGADLSTLNPSYYSVGYNGASLNLAFAPGTYEIRITEQGTKTVIYDSGGSELTPNIALAMVAYSRGSGSLVNVAVLQSQGPAGLLNTIFASIKGLNNAPVVGPVNQLLNTDPANLNIPFAATSAYFIGPAGPVLVGLRGERHAGRRARERAGHAGAGDRLFIVHRRAAGLAAGVRAGRRQFAAGCNQHEPALRQRIVGRESGQCRGERHPAGHRGGVSDGVALCPVPDGHGGVHLHRRRHRRRAGLARQRRADRRHRDGLPGRPIGRQRGRHYAGQLTTGH